MADTGVLIHQEDPEVDMVDVLEYYAGTAIVSRGDDGFTEIFDEDGCDTLEDDESVSMLRHQS
jgi:hypothetical protein